MNNQPHPPAHAVRPEAGAEAGGPWTLGHLFRAYRWRILFTYALFNVENLLALAQPYVLGLAINDVLKGAYEGVALLALQHSSHLLVGSWRRAYDTRAFTRIYTDLATSLVASQRACHVDVSRVAARSALSRHLVEFFEHGVPLTVQAIYSAGGALVVLAFYDGLLVLGCLALVVPAVCLNYFYARKTLLLNRLLNDQLEREVEVIERGRPPEVSEHYSLLARWRVKLSDWGSINFALTEVFVFALIVAALVRSCHVLPGATPGDIFAVFGYVLMFVQGMDNVPIIVEQLTLLRDVGRRLYEDAWGAGREPTRGPGGTSVPSEGASNSVAEQECLRQYKLDS